MAIMDLTTDQIDIITANPLDESFRDVRAKLRDCVDAPSVVRLLGALVDSSAALLLQTPDGTDDLASRLFSIQRGLRKSAINRSVRESTWALEPFNSLVNATIAGSPDIDIWAAVIRLIEDVKPLTPPPSTIIPTFLGTPVKTSSSRLDDSETREVVERELFGEIRKCTFRCVKGFWDKFFGPSRWREDQRAMMRQVLSTHNGKRWAEFPSTTDERPVWEWFRSLNERFLADAPHKLHTTRTANEFKERKGQMDIFFQTPTSGTKAQFEYKDILVVGEQKKTDDSGRFKATLLQLARHVRGVFSDQPTRRFVHAFSLCGSTMELWIFDRSGPYSSGPFDIHEEPDKFARALVGYVSMDDDEMGLDTFIERVMEQETGREEEHRYIKLNSTGGGEAKLRLVDAMVRQKAIVCRGTTCYKTEDDHVAKFSWVSDKRQPEVEHLELAEKRGVKGVTKVVAHHRITTIADLRSDLGFPSAHPFRGETVHFEDIPTTAASSKTSGSKRKSSSDHTSDASGPKRRSSSSRSKLIQEVNEQLSMGKNRPSLYTEGEEPWENRIYSCLVISPAGRVISNFRSVRELLESMRDAIKAHQSLYTTGNILHRDISSNNIIITEPKTGDDFRGMLIDLDLAKVRDSGPSGARHQTGTMQFMAVEVLRKADHTYRHDLESFFYVFLWMCARQSWRNGFAGQEQPPRESLLRRWEIGSFKYIAAAKEGDMTVNGLNRIMDEFPETLSIVKPLCLKIRKLLFPLDKDERMTFGTPAGEPDQLYAPTIAAYDETISKL